MYMYMCMYMYLHARLATKYNTNIVHIHGRCTNCVLPQYTAQLVQPVRLCFCRGLVEGHCRTAWRSSGLILALRALLTLMSAVMHLPRTCPVVEILQLFQSGQARAQIGGFCNLFKSCTMYLVRSLCLPHVENSSEAGVIAYAWPIIWRENLQELYLDSSQSTREADQAGHGYDHWYFTSDLMIVVPLLD